MREREKEMERRKGKREGERERREREKSANSREYPNSRTARKTQDRTESSDTLMGKIRMKGN